MRIGVPIGALVAAVVLVTAAAMSDPSLRGRLPFLAEECHLGLAGTSLAVTMKGEGAEQTCDENDGTIDYDTGASWYRLSADEIPGPRVLVCRFSTETGAQATVYDAGSFMVHGQRICSLAP